MTTNNFPAWPPTAPFPESQRDTVKDNSPDFPGSAGSREMGKFRASSTPKLTQVAVVNDDGSQIGWALVPGFEELADEIRKLRFALQLQGAAADLGDLDNGV